MFSKLIPHPAIFFDFLDEHADITLKGAKALFAAISASSEKIETSHIKTFEHQADQVTENCVKALYKTFITPIDREQIHALITTMDDIIDRIYGAANYLQIYRIQGVTPDFLQLLEILIKAVEQVQVAIKALRNLKNNEIIVKACGEIARLEHEADLVFRTALGNLFDNETDARQIIKWKDLYTSLEIATDRCHEVGNMIERILLEND